MITSGAVPALLPAYIGVSQTIQITIGPTLPTPCRDRRLPGAAGPPAATGPGRRPPAARRVVQAPAGAGDPQRRADLLTDLHRRLGTGQGRRRAGHAVPAVHRAMARRQGPAGRATTTDELIDLYRAAQRKPAAT